MKSKEDMLKHAKPIIQDLYHQYCKQSGDQEDAIYVSGLDSNLNFRVQKERDGNIAKIPRRYIDTFQPNDVDSTKKIMDCFSRFKNID